MWTHYCKPEKTWIGVGEDEPCHWCGTEDLTAPPVIAQTLAWDALTLKLTVAEINAALQTLGNLPTPSGARPLVVKIKKQAEAQRSDAADDDE